MKRLWTLSSFFLVLVCIWFATMEFIHHRPGFELRIAIAAAIVLYAVLSLRYTRTPSATLHAVLMLGSLGTFVLGIVALLTDIRATHFEGYILLIAIALLTQSLLAFRNLARHRLHPA